MEEIQFISLITLIQNPEKYQGKRIRLIGLCTLDFEGKAMWISREDLDKAVTKNAIWLDVKLDDQSKKLNGKFLLIEGTFDAKRKGHLGMYSGMVEHITRLELWEKEAAR